jgi:predicted dehydrogenase
MKSVDFMKNDVSRRQFLGSSAKNAAGMAAGMVGLAGSVAHASPGERVSVAVIGVRNQGRFLAGSFARFADVDVTMVCDVDERLHPLAAEVVQENQQRAPRRVQDYRRVLDDMSIDAVVIATPDHWHAPLTIAACIAGKDVYVEVPASHSVREGRRMVDAAQKCGRVVQSGLQQRSGSHFRDAIAFVRSGKLGSVKLAKAWTIHQRKSIGFKQEGPAPDCVDYDRWLGPAAARAFHPNRFHYNWRWFWEYGTGELGNWGVHLLDTARWGLDVEFPQRISAVGGKFHSDDQRETPDTLLVNYDFSGKMITWEHRLWSSRPLEGRSAAVAFYGDLGTLVVDRGGWKAYDLKETVTSSGSNLAEAHHRNFVDCVKSRELPAADIEVGHVSSGLCHLGNIAFRLGRELSFDTEQMKFSGDSDADELLSKEYRSGWDLPAI